MEIIPVPVLKDNYVWTIIDKEQHNALVIDPGDAMPVLEFLKKHQLNLQGILITHHHADHTGGITELIRHHAVPVIGSFQEKGLGITLPIQPDQAWRPEHFPLTFQVLGIPGHTLAHVAYYSPGMLFCGDTLFAAGCGRVFEGTSEQMYKSLQKLAALPDETNIYCGHEYTLKNLHFAEKVEPTNLNIKKRIAHVSELRKKNLPSLPATLAEEKKTNPFLRCDSPELIMHVEQYAGQKLQTPVDVFTWVRKWKDQQ